VEGRFLRRMIARGSDGGLGVSDGGPPSDTRPSSPGGGEFAQSFVVGEQVEVKVLAGPLEGTWAKSQIAAGPAADGSYDIEVFPEPGSQQPNVKAPKVDSRFLRRWFSMGEQVEVKVLSGPLEGTWANSEIIAGPAADGSYDIEVFPEHESQQPSVKAPKVESRFLRRRFCAGEQVEVAVLAGPRQGSWAKSQITAGPTDKGTYSIEVLPEPESQTPGVMVPNVEGQFIRRDAAAAESGPLSAGPVGRTRRARTREPMLREPVQP